MADKAIIQTATLTGIGDALREAGIAEADKLLSPDEMKQKLQGVAKRSQADLTASGAVVSVLKGYYPEAVSKSVETTGLGTPSITVDANGKITSSVTHTVSGYVEANTKTAEKQLPTQAGKTVTPTDAEQTVVSAGTYVTGDIKVAAAAVGGEEVENVYRNTTSHYLLVTTKNTISKLEKLVLVFQTESSATQIYGDGSGAQMLRIEKSGGVQTGNFSVIAEGSTIRIVTDETVSSLNLPIEFVSGVVLYT